jgi:hypothetical protein
MKTWTLLLVLCFSVTAADMDMDLMKRTYGPLKRNVSGRVVDLNPLVEWHVNNANLRRTPQMRSERPQQYIDWEFTTGDVLAFTNGMTYFKNGNYRGQVRFIALKNYAKKVAVGDNVSFLALNLKYSRTDYVNGSPKTWLAFDFGTPVK